MFGFWDWVGGRYSMGSAIGLSTMIAIGPEALRASCSPASTRWTSTSATTPLEREPAGAAWGCSASGTATSSARQTVAVLPYSQDLARFPAYLQQLEMESNGKRVTPDGSRVRWDDLAGRVGRARHERPAPFFQLLHQGTEIVPCELIAFTARSTTSARTTTCCSRTCFGQAEALAFGRSAEEVRASGAPRSRSRTVSFEGDRPSSVLLVDGADAARARQARRALRAPRADEGVLWGIDSFDQWGVELGKAAAGALADELMADAAPDLGHDAATNALVRRLRAARGRP